MTRTPLPECLGTAPSFGFGDRFGLATPGHLAALSEAGGPIRGIFAQQSVREMTRTDRTPQQVMTAAADAISAARFSDPWGADADHLKTADDVQRLMDAGFTFFTLDPSEHVDQHADRYDAATLADKFSDARAHAPWIDRYRGQKVEFGGVRIEFNDEALQRAAVKYGRAIAVALELAHAVDTASKSAQRPCEIELSVDETEEPTTPAEHYIIADQFRDAGVRLVSLAPRFVGDFEKGVDFKGDIVALEKSMQVHAAIARHLGPYKLSLHSGSDKLSMYPLLARATDGLFHVKTAGTSYLEALRVAAQKAPAFFREVIEYSRRRYDEDKATYHVSARLDDVPPPADEADDLELERAYLERWEDVPPGKGFTAPGRQILHCTFGSVLTHPRLGHQLIDLLKAEEDAYREVLRVHFVKHLQPLNAG